MGKWCSYRSILQLYHLPQGELILYKASKFSFVWHRKFIFYVIQKLCEDPEPGLTEFLSFICFIFYWFLSFIGFYNFFR